MFKSFIGVIIQGKRPDPEIVCGELINNPAYARTCGFTYPDPDGKRRQSDVPSLRKLQQFDKLMEDNGFWRTAAVEKVEANLRSGKIKIEAELTHDTTHYKASTLGFPSNIFFSTPAPCLTRLPTIPQA